MVVAAICIATAAAAAAAEEVGRVGLEGSRGVEGGKERELVVGVGYIYTGSEMDLRRQILGVRYGVGRLIWAVGG